MPAAKISACILEMLESGRFCPDDFARLKLSMPAWSKRIDGVVKALAKREGIALPP
jgi:hypothetical protein